MHKGRTTECVYTYMYMYISEEKYQPVCLSAWSDDAREAAVTGDGLFLASGPKYGNDWMRWLRADTLNILSDDRYFNSSFTSYCTHPSRQSCIMSHVSIAIDSKLNLGVDRR